jgi:hypothetical protein
MVANAVGFLKYLREARHPGGNVGNVRTGRNA